MGQEQSAGTVAEAKEKESLPEVAPVIRLPRPAPNKPLRAPGIRPTPQKNDLSPSAVQFVKNFLKPENQDQADKIRRALKMAIKKMRMHKAKIIQFQLDAHRLQDFWPRLQEGIRVTKQPRNLSKPVRKLLWIDQSGWRLCCTVAKTLTDQTTQKGLFLLDVSSIWSGARSTVFRQTECQLFDGCQCLSIIGSERSSLDLVMDSTTDRNELYEDLSALLRVMRRKAQKEGLGHYSQKVDSDMMAKETLSMADVAVFCQIKNQLICGVGVRAHGGQGNKMNGPCTMYLEKGRICLVRNNEQKILGWDEADEKSYLKRGTSSIVPEGINLTDIIEVRPGMFTATFADVVASQKTMAVRMDSLCFSLIGSERALNLEIVPLQISRSRKTSVARASEPTKGIDGETKLEDDEDVEQMQGKQTRDFLVKRFETLIKFVSIHTNNVSEGEPQVTYWNNLTLQSMLG